MTARCAGATNPVAPGAASVAQNEAAVGAVRGHLEGRPDPACCLLDSWYTYRGARLVPGFAGGLSTTAPLPRPQRLVPADRAHPLGGMDLPPVCVRTGQRERQRFRALPQVPLAGTQADLGPDARHS